MFRIEMVTDHGLGVEHTSRYCTEEAITPVTLSDVLSVFDGLLKSAGFFPLGELTYVEDDEDYTEEDTGNVL